MTGGDVHHPEMPTPDDLDERTVEAFLTGRSVATGEPAAMSVFADDLRVAVSGPPPAPSPQLARLLAEGFSVANHAEAAAPIADGAHAPTAGRPTQRRRKMMISGFLAALASKLAGLGVAAKVALGATLATATAATAGAAGVLPDPAQRAVATVVNATPFNIPDGTDDDDAVTDVTDAIPPAVGDGTGTGDDATDDATGDDATEAGDNHGACVSAVARQAPRGPGGVHGEAVSSAAKTCPKATDPDDEPTTTTSTTIASDDDVAGATNQGRGNRGQSNGGQGNGGQGQGNANRGQGNGGQGNGGQGNANSGPGNSGGRGK